MQGLKPIVLCREVPIRPTRWRGAWSRCVLIAGIVVGSRGFERLRPCAGLVCGRNRVCGLRSRLPLCDVAASAADAPVLVPGMADLSWSPGGLPRTFPRLARIFWNNVVLQRFIEKRSKRAGRRTGSWPGDACSPLPSRFRCRSDGFDLKPPPTIRRSTTPSCFGIPRGSFPLDSIVAPLAFNILDICAVMVLIGVFVAMWRRGRDRGAMAVQQFSNDLLPLILLFAISITGLFLTVSTHLMRGLHYVFLSQLHAVTVIFTLLYLPFGKFFHIFQRPAQLGVDFYKRAGEEGAQARCVRCGAAVRIANADGRSESGAGALGIRYQMATARTIRTFARLPPQESCADAGRSVEHSRAEVRRCERYVSYGEASDRCSRAGRSNSARRSTVPPGGWVPSEEDDKMVKTHCCFCGQQCGIQLRVRNNKVVGFEPWEDFPFNRGKLCPKGVKRYMQDEHPDRLKRPLQRVDGQGFEPIGLGRGARAAWSARSSASSRRYGNDAFAVLTGASLTNEKAYLMGKFARVALRTANIDYNGRLCMVSAGAASQEGLRHRPQRQSVERHSRGRGHPGRGRQHRRVRADHHRLSVAGARERRQADHPRSAHDADRAQRRSVHPGALGRRHRRLQRHAARDDRARLDRPRLHRAAHHRLRRGGGERQEVHAGVRGEDRRRSSRR